MGLLCFLQQCLNAVQASCFYALLAVAYVLVHGTGYFTGEYRDAASFGALTFLLIVRPNGLFSPTLSPDERV